MDYYQLLLAHLNCISAATELIRQRNTGDRRLFAEKLGLDESGLDLIFDYLQKRGKPLTYSDVGGSYYFLGDP